MIPLGYQQFLPWPLGTYDVEIISAEAITGGTFDIKVPWWKFWHGWFCKYSPPWEAEPCPRDTPA